MTQFLWRMRLLGGFHAANGTQAFSRFRTQKTGSLLAFLALHPAHTHAREALPAWPHGQGFIAPTSAKRAGNLSDALAREMVTIPSSMG